MNDIKQDSTFAGDLGNKEIVTDVGRNEAALKAGALQNAIFNSANF